MHFSVVGTPSIVGSANGAPNEPPAHSLAEPVHGFGPSRPPRSCARPGVPAKHITSVARLTTIRMGTPPLRADARAAFRRSAYRRVAKGHVPAIGETSRRTWGK